MSDYELKPCPFCGSYPTEELINQGFDSPEWWIECSNDSCPVTPGLGDGSRLDAVDRWNTRT